MADSVSASVLRDSRKNRGAVPDGLLPAAVTRVFIPLTTPFLYGMERAVIELFDSLRPGIEPYFLQSNRIYQRKPPIIREMIRRGFSMQLLPDTTDWERLAKPRSLVHLWRMITATLRVNIAIFKGASGKDVLYVPSISVGSGSILAALLYRITGRRVIHHFHDLGANNRLFPLWIPLVTDFVHNTEFGYQDIVRKLPAIKHKRNFIVPYILEVDERLPEDSEVCRWLKGKRNLFYIGQVSRHKGVDLLLEAFKLVALKYPVFFSIWWGDVGTISGANLIVRLRQAISRIVSGSGVSAKMLRGSCDLPMFTFTPAHLAGFMSRSVAAWSRRWPTVCQPCVFVAERCRRSSCTRRPDSFAKKAHPRSRRR